MRVRCLAPGGALLGRCACVAWGDVGGVRFSGSGHKRRGKLHFGGAASLLGFGVSLKIPLASLKERLGVAGLSVPSTLPEFKRAHAECEEERIFKFF